MSLFQNVLNDGGFLIEKCIGKLYISASVIAKVVPCYLRI